MPRLPIPGEDAGTWGDILNEFLEVSHNSDGSLRNINLDLISNVDITDIQDGNVLLYNQASSTWINTASVSESTANTIVKRDADGRAQFADGVAAQDVATKGQVDAIIGDNIVRVLHDGLSYPTRPEGSVYVEWVGPTSPGDQVGLTVLSGDTWVATV